MASTRHEQRSVRHRRLRARVRGTAARPRLTVFRSARHLSAQLIDDVAARTLLAVSDVHLGDTARVVRGVSRAAALGTLLGERARTQGITTVVFDRSGYAYAGQVKALAEAAREAGLTF